MVGAGQILYYLVHPQELRSIIQWKTWHNPVHERDPSKEAETLKICFSFLDMTSRSFAAVIQELHPELLVPVALFYLVLRGLDTVEDDMTIPIETKEPILRNFYKHIAEEGWRFTGNGPKEKDRELLVQFQNVTHEFNKIKPVYQKIIADIAKRMGNGMADYCKQAAEGVSGVDTVEDYDLYCFYVAGLVGEGLTRLFVEANLATPALLNRPRLHSSMGLFLQKVNIIRDVREDWGDDRRFWPKEIWSKHVTNFEDLFDPKNAEKAMQCGSEMVLNALDHAEECLFYLAGLKEQSIFNFCAIPQTMAIATLDVCFNNPKMFQRNVKITKGSACQLMMESTQNHQLVCDVFRRFARKIQKKNDPRDPNFLKITIACSKIDQFIEGLYPSVPKPTPEAQVLVAEKTAQDKAKEAEARQDTMMMMIAVLGTLFFVSAIMIGIAWLAGARFDVAISELKGGRLSRPGHEEAQKVIHKYDHGEL